MNSLVTFLFDPLVLGAMVVSPNFRGGRAGGGGEPDAVTGRVALLVVAVGVALIYAYRTRSQIAARMRRVLRRFDADQSSRQTLGHSTSPAGGPKFSLNAEAATLEKTFAEFAAPLVAHLDETDRRAFEAYRDELARLRDQARAAEMRSR